MSEATPPVTLFEDIYATQMGQLGLCRPLFELVCGGMSLRERFLAVTGVVPAASLLREHLRPFEASPVDTLGERLYINAAYRAEGESWSRIQALAAETALVTSDERLLALRTAFPADRVRAIVRGADEALPGTLAAAPAGNVTLVRHPWELVTSLEEHLHADLLLAIEGDAFTVLDADQAGKGVLVRGQRVHVAPNVSIEGPCVLDSRHGPIVLAAGASVLPFSNLRGPLFVGPGSRVLGGPVGSSYIGPQCKVRGEVESTVFLGYANKAHDGFVGHSYLGRWVNLGALTTTSDLKNNYGLIRVRDHQDACQDRPDPGGLSVSPAAGPITSEAMPGAGAAARAAADAIADGASDYTGQAAGGGQWVDQVTGRIKLGSFLADHAKTAIGTLLGAGTVLGVGANLFGATGPAPRYVPSFAWGCGRSAGEYDWDRFIETAAVVMDRRGRTLTAGDREVLAAAFTLTASARHTYIASERG